MTRHAGPVDAEHLHQINVAVSTLARVSYSRRARQGLERRAGVNLGPTAISTLAAIRALTPATNRAVAARVGLQASRISKEVRSLVDAGLVAEEGDPHDRRVTRLRPTAAGEAAHAAYHRAADDALADVLTGWSADDVRTLSNLLTRLARGFARPEPADDTAAHPDAPEADR